MLFGPCDIKVKGDKLSKAIVTLVYDIYHYEASAENLLSFGIIKAFQLTERAREMRKRGKDIQEAIYTRYLELFDNNECPNSFLGNMAQRNKIGKEEPMSKEDIVGGCAGIVFAAYGSTKLSTLWGIHNLKENLEIQEKVF